MRRASRTPASYQPATWNTTSARDTAAWNRGRVTSPTTKRTPRASRSFPRAGSRVRTETSHPPDRRTSTRCRPMSPVPPVTNARIRSAFPQDDGQDVGVFQGMLQADLLTGELRRRAPYVGVAEAATPVAVDCVAHHAHVGIGLDDERVREVRLLTLRFQEDPHEPQRLVNLVLEAREPDPFLRGDRHELPLRELRLPHGRVDREAAAPAPRQRDVRRPFVEPDPRQPQLVHEDVHVRLEDVDHQQDEVAPAGDGQDLLPAAAALGGAADQPRHVEDLDLRAAVLEQARDDVERGEVVRRDGARRIRDLIEQRRLADGREADQTERCVPALLDRVARAATAGLEPPRLLFVLEARDLRLQLADVMLRCLVVRRPLDLVFDGLDLFLERRHLCGSQWNSP